MDLKLILKTFSNLRRMTSDEVAFLETLRAMNESECEALVETLSPQPARKSSTKKSASKKSARASSLEQQIQKRPRLAVPPDDNEDDGRCTYRLGEDAGGPVICDATVDNNVHHKQGDPDYHLFSPAAPTASDLSSANGGAGSGIQNFEDETASVGSVVHEASAGD